MEQGRKHKKRGGWKRVLGMVLSVVMILGSILNMPGLTLSAKAEETVYSVTVKVNQGVGGKVQINDRTPVSTSDTDYFTPRTVKLTAIPDEGYRIAYWYGPAGHIFGEAGSCEMNHTISRNDATFEAYFVPVTSGASVAMEDIDLGVESVGYKVSSGGSFPTYYIRKNVKLKNTGDCLIVPASACIRLGGTNADCFRAFTDSTTGGMKMNKGDSLRNWYVVPKADLPVGVYEATMTFIERCQPALDTPATAKIRFEVTDDPVITAKSANDTAGSVTGGGRYQKGETVTLTATANDHYRFVKWSDGSTANPYSFEAQEAVTLTATFEQYEYKVTVYPNGEGGKIKVGDGEATSEKQILYLPKGEVQFTAIPDEGYRMAYWQYYGAYSGNPGSCELTRSLSSNCECIAYFVPKSAQVSAQMPDVDLGVASEGYKVSSGGTYPTYYIKGDILLKNTGKTSLAPYDACIRLSGGDDSSFRVLRTYYGIQQGLLTPNQSLTSYSWIVVPKAGLPAGTYEETMTFVERCQPAFETPVTAKVTFTVTPKYLIETAVSPEGAGTVEGAGEYDAGETVTLTATPGENFAFDHWEIGNENVSSENPYVFEADQAKTVKAVFRRMSYHVTISADPSEGGTVSSEDFTGNSVNLTEGSKVTVKAQPKAGYRFLYWKDNGKQIGNEAEISVSAIVDHTLVAYFEELTEAELPEAPKLTYNGREQTAFADTSFYTVTKGKAKNAGAYTATFTLKESGIWPDGSMEPKTVAWKIDPAEVPIEVQATDRTYKAGDKSVSVSARIIDGIWGEDVVELDVSDMKAQMADDTAGGAKAVTITGLALKGTDAGNYKIAELPDVTVNISKAAIVLTVSMEGWTRGEAAKTPEISGNAGNGAVQLLYKQKGEADSAYSENQPEAAGNYTVRAVASETTNYEGGSAETDFAIVKANGPEAPTGLVATPASMAGADDGKILGVTPDMEYALVSDFTGATKCEGTQLTGLVAGTYYVRYAETEDALAGKTATVTVADGEKALAGTVVISGETKFGGTLTADILNDNNTGTLSYQWKRDGADISGATDKDYAVTKADIGASLSCEVRSSKQLGYLLGIATALVEKKDGPASPEGLTVTAVSIAGAKDGKISGVTDAMEYSQTIDFSDKKACQGQEISGLLAGTYYVRLAETDEAKAGRIATVIVPDGPNALTGTVSISGKLTYGETLTATVGADTNNTGELKYQWKRESLAGNELSADSKDIEGATASAYKLTKEDIGCRILCEVTSSIEKGGISGVTNGIVEKADGPAAPEDIVGIETSAKGKADGKISKTKSGMEYSVDADFSVAENIVTIAGEEVTGLAAGTYYVRTAETDTVKAGEAAKVIVAEGKDVLKGIVEIDGKEAFGQLLTVTVKQHNCTGTLKYQWKRSDVASESFTDIDGAVFYTYKLTKDDIGRKILCEVTSTEETGSISAVTSAAIDKANGPAAPNGLKAVSPSEKGKADGKITGTRAGMEYSSDEDFSKEENIVNITDNEVTGLTAGTYYIRMAETDTTKSGNATKVLVEDGPEGQQGGEQQTMVGDVNGDKKVDRADRMYLARALAGWNGYEIKDKKAADVNGDNKVDRADRMYLARALAGWNGYSIK